MSDQRKNEALELGEFYLLGVGEQNTCKIGSFVKAETQLNPECTRREINVPQKNNKCCKQVETRCLQLIFR